MKTTAAMAIAALAIGGCVHNPNADAFVYALSGVNQQMMMDQRARQQAVPQPQNFIVRPTYGNAFPGHFTITRY